MSEKEKETGEIEERDGFIAIPDGSLYYKKYDIQGKVGLPVVLLHGNRGTHRDFSSYIEVLTKVGCSVIAMDSRGHGASVMKMAALKAAVLKTGRSQEKGKRRRWSSQKNFLSVSPVEKTKIYSKHYGDCGNRLPIRMAFRHISFYRIRCCICSVFHGRLPSKHSEKSVVSENTKKINMEKNLSN